MSRCLLLVYGFILFFITRGHLLGVKGEIKNYYIVFLSDQSVNKESKANTHISLLSALKGSELDAKKAHVYSYTKSFNAFAAKLSESEARDLSGMDGVQSVILNQYRKLHTTRSWDFIGFPQTARRKKLESDVIIGVMDTGITPQSESFNDNGFGPPPAKWKGSCHHFANFSGCNNKLIGAKYFKLDGNPDPGDILSPVDTDGHGTHTSSTAAGSPVHNAELFGLAKGTARGAVPSARVAMYKVCWASSGCSDMDLLAGFDAAIHDGVDIISISIGGLTGAYTSDTMSVASFHAMNKGILTVASAGNDGPSLGSVTNHAPWLLTVAASGIDRGFQSKVVLGNGKTLTGIGINGFNPKQKLYPITSGADVAINSESQESAGFCLENTLDPSKVKGKLVECKLGTWGSDSVIKGLGGVGTIIESEVFLDTPMIFMAPATMVNSTAGEIISKYIHSTRSPSAVIHKSEQVKVSAPFVATFSSRGPNPGTKHVLKPDIAAPGVDILAAYTPLHTLTGLQGDTQYSKFTIMSGTSMACPHVAGTAAYVKSFHPNWSPAAIKSAIMTSARPMSSRVNQNAELDYGVGQLNPRRAVSPGLIYDMDSMSYVQFLCHEGYDGSSIATLIGSKSKIDCASLLPPLVSEDAINYPTMQLTLKKKKGITTGIFRRSVTNVGHDKSIYNANIRAPKGVNITVEPTTLSFSHASQRRSFKVTVSANFNVSKKLVVSGSLIWRSCCNIVRSPIVVVNPQYES
ncbi:putative cucumisin [Helianthus annuus]|uniref:Cucumisin n=1 Tax=Helianthus annuus TaxID=4232 RepID=A0A251VDV0_HELAN|nr:subtilisin-like protease SBT4.14 isoform X1 [Helianthus annuus]KAF5816796.1 putative cucumisin [Helianthus annuus]KAJ0938143.1 putative cucumisin [Helianthus annuus]KAJ0946041.1 putative cucumisin [Helianthus annuus]